MIKQALKSCGGMVAVMLALTAPSAAQEIKLSLTHQNAPTSWYISRGINPWIQKVEQATKGRVKIQLYPSQTLVKGADSWKGVKSGVTDIAWCFHGYWPEMTPNADVLTLPFLPYPSAEKGGEVAWKLYEKFPVLQKELADVKVLMVWVSSPYFLMTSRKLVKTLDDLKGMKIRVTGGPPTEQIKALGGVPMLIPQPDNYDALDKGVIDGLATNWEAVHAFRFHEVAPNYTIVPLSAVYFTLVMNKSKWNGLPKDVQDAIMSVSGLKGSMEMGKGTYDSAEQGVMEMIKSGKYAYNRYDLPPEELARWRKVGGEPIWDDWVKKMETKGNKQARELLNATLELLKN